MLFKWNDKLLNVPINENFTIETINDYYGYGLAILVDNQQVDHIKFKDKTEYDKFYLIFIEKLIKLNACVDLLR